MVSRRRPLLLAAALITGAASAVLISSDSLPINDAPAFPPDSKLPLRACNPATGQVGSGNKPLTGVLMNDLCQSGSSYSVSYGTVMGVSRAIPQFVANPDCFDITHTANSALVVARPANENRFYSSQFRIAYSVGSNGLPSFRQARSQTIRSGLGYQSEQTVIYQSLGFTEPVSTYVDLYCAKSLPALSSSSPVLVEMASSAATDKNTNATVVTVTFAVANTQRLASLSSIRATVTYPQAFLSFLPLRGGSTDLVTKPSFPQAYNGNTLSWTFSRFFSPGSMQRVSFSLLVNPGAVAGGVTTANVRLVVTPDRLAPVETGISACLLPDGCAARQA